jgi:DNA-directed RNA polymerase specialized sigma subunit
VESVANAKRGAQDDWVSILENEIHLKQMLCYLDERTRDMLMLRISGDSWTEIGERFGISAHNAEVQFANGAKKARSRLLRAGLTRLGRGQQ